MSEAAKNTSFPSSVLFRAAAIKLGPGVFFVGAIGSYFGTPTYGFNGVFGAAFLFTFVWPSTMYMFDIEKTTANKDGSRRHMSAMRIAQHFAISVSFMASVVLIASAIHGRLQVTAPLAAALPAFVRDAFADGPSWVTTTATAAGWGASYVVHFVGLGLIPRYLNALWTSIKETATQLASEDK